MSFSPEDIDKDLRRHSEAVREYRTQRNNDRRIAAGLMPTHCGVEVKLNGLGDYECVKCGDVF
jgi:hypothetical protein